MKLAKIFSSKIFLISTALILIILGVAEIRQLSTRQAINKEIATLKAQEQEYEQKTQDIETSLDALNIPEYKEKLARRQLNLKKDGEIVVNYPPNSSLTQDKSDTPQTVPNYKKWWDYFFSNK